MSCNQINFLPPSFMKERARQLRIVRESMLVAIVAALIIVWYVVAQGRVANLESIVASRQADVQAVTREINDMATLGKERDALLHQLKLERELSQPVNLSMVMASIAQAMPSSMAMTDLSMQTPVPQPPTKEKAKSDKGQSKSKNAARVDPPAPVMQVGMVGIAASDLDVADFIGKLTQNPLFSRVQLSYTRAIEVKQKNIAGREFRIEIEIKLDRLYIAPSRPQSQGVAHAF